MKTRIKNSIEYWGKIPSTWDYIEIRHGFHQIGSGTTPTSGKEEYYENGSIPWINTSELREKTISEPENYVTPLALEHFSALKIFNEGTLLIAMYGATIGRMGILGIPACVNQAVCALSKPINLSIDFTAYALQASKDYLLSLASGGGQPNLNAEKLVSHKIPCPPLEQQQTIASYLDQKTSTIDQLIEAKQKLIGLLNEKRQAFITHAITRGIDHQAPLKDSGIEWIDEIPAHWELEKVKNIVTLSNNRYSTDSQQLEYIGLEHIESWTGRITTKAMEWDSEQYGITNYFEDGDVLFGKLRPYLAKAFIARGNGICSTELLVMKPKPQVIPKFLLYVLLSEGFINIVNSETFGAKMPRADWDTIGNIRITFPPLAEQTAIVVYIERETQKIDALKTAAERTIELLRERRSALIHAAVTGQIDVG